MTKAELKMKETEARRKFICDAAKVVMDVTFAVMSPAADRTEIRLNLKGYNRYFFFHRYGEDLKVRINRSGDIDIVLREAFHEDVETRIVYYEEAAKNPELALALFRDDMMKLIDDYMNFDWHIVMDYMSPFEKGKDWHACFEENRRRYHQ